MAKSLISKMTFKVDSLDFFSFTHDKNKINNEGIKEGTALYNLHLDYKKLAMYTSHTSKRRKATVLKDHFTTIPKLLTVAIGINGNHPPSVLGDYILDSIGYTHSNDTPQEFIDNYNGKYVAKLVKCFDITQNRIETWNEFCTNGLFNIWNPAAPYNRLNFDKKPYEHQVDAFKYNLKTKKYDVHNEKWRSIYYQRKGTKILLLRIYELNEEDIYGNNEIKINNSVFDTIKPRRVLLDNPVIDDVSFSCIYSEILDTLNNLKKSIEDFNFSEDSRGESNKLKYIPPEERNCNNEKFNV